MTNRVSLIDAFLKDNDWEKAGRKALPFDLSHRRYQRLTREKESVLLMDAPPQHEDVRPYIAIAKLLTGLGYSAPKVLAEDVANGLLLVEDFGYATFTRVLKAGLMTERDLYGLAIDFLADLHCRDLDQVQAKVPPYSDDDLLVEGFLFLRWYLPHVGAQVTEALESEYLDIMRQIVTLSRTGVPEHLVLRDFHVDNLMMLRGRHGLQQLGLLDFQDAVMGPVTYDIASLLQDARRDVSQALAVEMTSRYLKAYPEQDPLTFMASASAMAVQRHLKVLGIFMRQSVVNQNHSKLIHMDRLWRMIDEDSRHPSLSFFRKWLDSAVPDSKRKVKVPTA